MSDTCEHSKLYALDFANQPKRLEGGCLFCGRDDLQSRLNSCEQAMFDAGRLHGETLRRLGSIEKFDEASGLCCVKGCTELSVWCCPPLCEHHTALLEPVVETSAPIAIKGEVHDAFKAATADRLAELTDAEFVERQEGK